MRTEMNFTKVVNDIDSFVKQILFKSKLRFVFCIGYMSCEFIKSLKSRSTILNYLFSFFEANSARKLFSS